MDQGINQRLKKFERTLRHAYESLPPERKGEVRLHQALFRCIDHDDLAFLMATIWLNVDTIIEASAHEDRLHDQIFSSHRKLIRNLRDTLEQAPSKIRRDQALDAARGRWSRLDGAKALAFERRKEFHTLSRSRAIDKMLPEILESCRKAGVPLTGSDPKRTVTNWLRAKGIK